jgi:hypothetical protein
MAIAAILKYGLAIFVLVWVLLRFKKTTNYIAGIIVSTVKWV